MHLIQYLEVSYGDQSPPCWRRANRGETGDVNAEAVFPKFAIARPSNFRDGREKKRERARESVERSLSLAETLRDSSA